MLSDCEWVPPWVLSVVLTHQFLPNRLGSTQHPAITQIFPPSEYSRPLTLLLPLVVPQLLGSGNFDDVIHQIQSLRDGQNSFPHPARNRRPLDHIDICQTQDLETGTVWIQWRPVYWYSIPRWDVKRWPWSVMVRQAVILIENTLEHFQILVEARCRCSRGWRWVPVEKKGCCTYKQRCGQGEMSNTDRHAAILIKFLPEHFQPLAEARRSCIDRQRCGLAEAQD